MEMSLIDEYISLFRIDTNDIDESNVKVSVQRMKRGLVPFLAQ